MKKDVPTPSIPEGLTPELNKFYSDLIQHIKELRLDASAELYPIGSQYWQAASVDDDDVDVALPESEAPATLFGGTWEKLWDTEGIVFQTEGYDGAGRSDGLMEDQLQGHRHTFYKYGDSGTGGPDWAGVNAKSTHTVSDPSSDGTNGTPRIGTRTCHRNRLVRIWKRAA